MTSVWITFIAIKTVSTRTLADLSLITLENVVSRTKTPENVGNQKLYRLNFFPKLFLTSSDGQAPLQNLYYLSILLHGQGERCQITKK